VLYKFKFSTILRFGTLAEASIKITVFWDVTMCDLLEKCTAVKMESAGSSEKKPSI
jgi:hypothetical protein